MVRTKQSPKETKEKEIQIPVTVILQCRPILGLDDREFTIFIDDSKIIEKQLDKLFNLLRDSTEAFYGNP